MPELKSIERKIRKKEKVDVIFTKNNKDVRGDKNIPTQYQAERMLKGSATVSNLKAKVKKQYPGYDFRILKADGTEASGQTTLANVRATYDKK